MTWGDGITTIPLPSIDHPLTISLACNRLTLLRRPKGSCAGLPTPATRAPARASTVARRHAPGRPAANDPAAAAPAPRRPGRSAARSHHFGRGARAPPDADVDGGCGR